jgi:hypothetical protein
MPRSVVIQLDLPHGWEDFRLPSPLQARLQSLLDQQDQHGQLPAQLRKEAMALTQLADLLSLLKLSSEAAARGSTS